MRLLLSACLCVCSLTLLEVLQLTVALDAEKSALGLHNLYRSLIPSKGKRIVSFGLHAASCSTDAGALFIGVT